MRLVTDPDILEELEKPIPTSILKPVTNPDILSQLEEPEVKIPEILAQAEKPKEAEYPTGVPWLPAPFTALPTIKKKILDPLLKAKTESLTEDERFAIAETQGIPLSQVPTIRETGVKGRLATAGRYAQFALPGVGQMSRTIAAQMAKPTVVERLAEKVGLPSVATKAEELVPQVPTKPSPLEQILRPVPKPIEQPGRFQLPQEAIAKLQEAKAKIQQPPEIVRLYRGETKPRPYSDDPVSKLDRETFEPDKFRGQWWTTDLEKAKPFSKGYYDPEGKILYIDIPKEQLEQYRVSNIPEAKAHSLNPSEEFILPKELTGKTFDQAKAKLKPVTSPEIVKQLEQPTSKEIIPLKPKPFDPETDTLADFIRKEGGIKTTEAGEAQRFTIREGYGLINTKTGKNLDALRERAVEEGFIDRDTTLSEFTELIRKDVDAKVHGTPGQVWSLAKQDWFKDVMAGEVGFSPQGLFRRSTQGQILPGQTAPKTSEIVKFISEKLDVPVRFGRFKGKALGIFKVKPEVIRTKLANDVDVTAHEIGHYLEKTLFQTTKRQGQGLTGAAFQQFKHELIPIATKHNQAGNKTVEGFAEFVRRYVTNDAEARRVAPQFYQWWDNLLQKKHPEIRQVLLRAREDFNKYMSAPATERVRLQISRLPNKDRLTARSLWDRFYTQRIDRLHPIQRARDIITKGKPIIESSDPYILARTFAGWIRKGDWFVKRGPSDWNTGRAVGPGLEQIVAPIRNQWENFWDYAAARRVVDDLAQRFGASAIRDKTGLPIEDWKATLQAYDNPVFRETLTQVHQYQDQVFNYLADSYGLSKEVRMAIRKANQSYVPFYRVMDEPGVIAGERMGGTGRTLSYLPQPVKKLKGSTREIIDPVESVLKNTFAYVNLAERNAVGKALVDLAKNTPGAGRIVEGPLPIAQRPIKFAIGEVKPVKAVMDQLTDILTKAGINPEDIPAQILDEVATIFRPSTIFKAENHITVWENGKLNVYRVSPDLYRAMLDLDREAVGGLIKLLAIPANVLRVGATTTPEFMARNPLRDQWTAAINTGLGIKTPYFTIRGLFHVLNQDQYYDLWVRGGGAQSTLVRLSRTEIQKRIAEMVKDPSVSKTLIRHPWQSIRLLSQFGEEATRLGVFEKKLGPDVAQASKSDILKAAFESREATLDFSRIGAKTIALNQIAAFWNPNVQGIDKLARAAKENPLRFALYAGAGITLPSMYLVLSQVDDVRWRQIPQWQKDVSWIILTGPKITEQDWQTMTLEQKRSLYRNTIWRIPKPFELGVVFGSIPERVVERLYGQNPQIVKSLAQTLGTGGVSALIPIPTALIPILENFANYSTFLDRPIVPRGLEDLEPKYQVTGTTSQFARKIGEAINYSPAKIDNLIRGYTGGLGLLATDSLEIILKHTGIVDLPPLPQKTLADIPLIRGFVSRFPTGSAVSIETFYEKYMDSQRTVKTYKALIKSNRLDEARRYFEEHQQDIEKSQIMLQVSEGLQGYHQVIRGIYEDKEMTPEQKRKTMDLAYTQMIDLAQLTLLALYPIKPD